MNIFFTIIIAGMIGTGGVPATPGEDGASIQNIPPQALLYSVEAKDNAQNVIDPVIWDQILAGMAGSGNAEFMEVYLVSGKDLATAKKLARLPVHDHSYSMNVPPASKILYIGKRMVDGKPSYSVNGIVNMQKSWVYISAVLKGGSINLFTQDENKTFTALQNR